MKCSAMRFRSHFDRLSANGQNRIISNERVELGPHGMNVNCLVPNFTVSGPRSKPHGIT
jgi:hypothetical protein